ncbi:MAG: hypothetical protein DNFNHJIP_00714 [Candidatus Argoarchaeum ethanivorans]|uniref:HicB family protein n=1 Tax=Candidatus Argoarchaeum ethanivorans TaxID=2608793 RepID=A0A812A0Z9_9EURY|nr:MAG: hypothetical protein DNFNHJIP_00714 [Candidatus Argoarchaeum ethanivorans]
MREIPTFQSQQEENMYVVECTEVGTVSQGKTIEEAIGNLREATGLYLEGGHRQRMSLNLS